MSKSESENQNPLTANEGDLLELTVGPVAHGGHCVARLDGRVIFVRHALPGERVMAKVTSASAKASFWRADAVEILERSDDRVPSAWKKAGPGGVGGAELAHVSLPAQRAWKAAVIKEQLAHLAKLELDVEVLAAPGDEENGGLGWRTRFDLIADEQGRLGMRGFRSHEIFPLHTMPLGSPAALEMADSEKVFTGVWTPGNSVEVVAPANGTPGIVLLEGQPQRKGFIDTRTNARRNVTETVSVDGKEYEYRVAAAGFWQVHREAPSLLAQTVLDLARKDGQDLEDATIVDLFSGAGLFSVPLADSVGPVGRVIAIEGDERACKDARRNLHTYEQAEVHVGQVAQILSDNDHGAMAGADIVVLDPPRAGAGEKVVNLIARLDPAKVIYVACDPAALARDISYFQGLGYKLDELRAFDLFPMTHHVECVALLVKTDQDAS